VSDLDVAKVRDPHPDRFPRKNPPRRRAPADGASEPETVDDRPAPPADAAGERHIDVRV